MAYVVTDSCINHKHTICVDVCPVDAFREGPEMLVIDPKTCIECNACVAECPEQAIFPQSAVPEAKREYIEINAAQAPDLPVIRESRRQHAAAGAQDGSGTRFAVVGSGPSGFFAAEALLRQLPAAQVDIFEKLPTPFGLIRYGVAPDHQRIKSVSAGFERIAESPQVRFFGNVALGQDLKRDELLSHYHGVVYATGGSRSRPLAIPGADSPNTFGSSEFVGWYNGHPDHQGLAVNLEHRRAVIIGMGNVALDIARMLVLSEDELGRTDMADEALDRFAHSQVNDVVLLARRGPLQAAFTPKELEQLLDLDGVDISVDPELLEQAALSDDMQTGSFEAAENLRLLQEAANRAPRGGKRIRFEFFASPTAIGPDESAGGRALTLDRTRLRTTADGRTVAEATGEQETLDCGLIVHATGYQGEPLDDVPFNADRGVVVHQDGRLTAATDSRGAEYAAGWIKRGASGVIGSNKTCATASVSELVADLPASPRAIGQDITALLEDRGIEYVSFADWQLLDEHEQQQGRERGRPRRKITDVPAMLTVIREARRQKALQAEREANQPVKTHYRSCTLCEAMCGVVIRHRGDTIVSIEGDPDDPHSRGHICPKGYALQDLHNDPDRLKTPLEKVDGQWVAIDWETALDKAARKLADIQARHGDDALAGYWGNPSSHNLGLLMSAGGLRKAMGSRNMFTAASLDQMPHQLASYLMFGNSQMFTIPDIDRTDYMLMLGANPAVSNGSLMTAGDILGRLENIRERGGKVLLIDPRRNETARYVDEHHFIRPGTDALFLIGLIRHIIDQDLCQPGRLMDHLDDWDGLLEVFRNFPMIDISAQCGVPEADIRRIAEDFASAERAVCYGRMGVATQAYGTLNHWLINVLNIITGNLDRAGGAMFTNPAFHKALDRRSGSFGKFHSRVRGLPEFSSSLPSAAMAEEMATPGEGQVRGLVCVAGNPALSTPNGGLMEKGLASLEYMVSIDFYLNETSRHADLILPPTGPLEHEQYDIVFNLLAVRNLARYTDPLFHHGPESKSDWDIVQELTARLTHYKSGSDAPFEMPAMPSPEQILDKGLRTGPYGERFTEYNSGEPVEHNEGLSVEVLRRYPHGLDLGPLQPHFPDYLFNEEQKICSRPAAIVGDLQRLISEFSDEPQEAQALRLIGRRDLRTNNSWMHNSQRLVKGGDRCALFIHPDDATLRHISDGSRVRVTTRAGEVVATVKLTSDIMPGVVSLPHGWGHDLEGVALRVASANPGINANDVTDNLAIDELSGNAAFNGVPVKVAPADQAVTDRSNPQPEALAER